MDNIKPNNLSKNIVNVMKALAKNEGLARLLVNNVENPYVTPVGEEGRKNLITQDSVNSKIFPVPFDPDAQTEDTSFIRVYYNQGDFDNEILQDLSLHVDIVVAKSLWLINDGTNSLIRPYEIMDRVIDLVGKKSANSSVSVKFDGWQHLAVNTKFDAIRLYSNYFNVETNYHTYEIE